MLSETALSPLAPSSERLRRRLSRSQHDRMARDTRVDLFFF